MAENIALSNLRRAIYDHFHDVDAALAEMDPYAPAYAGTELQQSTDKIAKTNPYGLCENKHPGTLMINSTNITIFHLGKNFMYFI